MVEIVDLLAFKAVSGQMGTLYSHGRLDSCSVIIHG